MLTAYDQKDVAQTVRKAPQDRCPWDVYNLIDHLCENYSLWKVVGANGVLVAIREKDEADRIAAQVEGRKIVKLRLDKKTDADKQMARLRQWLWAIDQ